MKLLVHLSFVIVLGTISCNYQEDIEPTTMDDDCMFHIPFYEQQDSSASSLSLECNCLDSFIDLSSKLASYSNVEYLNFYCDIDEFNHIPTMPSVKHLISDITTSNVLAFPNLEVFKNRVAMKRPLSAQLIFLPDLKEMSLLNVTNFPDIIGTMPLDIFKMTFQNTATETIALPVNLPKLINLKELNIRNIELANFTGFDALENLEHLNLSNVLWVRIPNTDNQWSKLKTLELEGIEMRGSGNIPDFFDDMDSLESIYISETPVTTTTQEHIAKAPNLKELILSYCDLGAIPDDLGNLTSLEKLIITTEQNTINESITLPTSIGNLINLKSIFISTNTNQFPTGLLDLKNTLEIMGIEDNIGSVPQEIGQFTALERLTLKNCGLTSLPSEIQNLATHLERLYLSGNNFDEATKQQIQNWLPNTDIYF